MRNFLKAASVVLLYLIVCGQGCNDRPEEDAARAGARDRAARDSIVSVFSTDTLSVKTLRAFELTAANKLSDLSDYLRIFRDTSTGPVFKKQAGEMISGLFISAKMSEQFLSPGGRGERWGSDSVSIFKPLTRENDTLCSGQLACRPGQHTAALKAKDAILEDAWVIDIFAVKRKVIFGSDTLKVWKVLLGDIR